MHPPNDGSRFMTLVELTIEKTSRCVFPPMEKTHGGVDRLDLVFAVVMAKKNFHNSQVIVDDDGSEIPNNHQGHVKPGKKKGFQKPT